MLFFYIFFVEAPSFERQGVFKVFVRRDCGGDHAIGPAASVPPMQQLQYPPADGPGGVTPPPPAPAAGGPGGVTSPAPFASFVRQCLKCGEMSHFREGCCLKSKCEGWQCV